MLEGLGKLFRGVFRVYLRRGEKSCRVRVVYRPKRFIFLVRAVVQSGVLVHVQGGGEPFCVYAHRPESLHERVKRRPVVLDIPSIAHEQSCNVLSELVRVVP